MIRRLFKISRTCLSARVFWGRSPATVPGPSIIFFPCQPNLISCGFAGIVAVKNKPRPQETLETAELQEIVIRIRENDFSACKAGSRSFAEYYLGGSALIDALSQKVRTLKTEACFFKVFSDPDVQEALAAVSDQISGIIATEQGRLNQQTGALAPRQVTVMSGRIESLLDIRWSLTNEILENISRIKELLLPDSRPLSSSALTIFREINSVFNSIDRLEVRGRDSAGLSLMLTLDRNAYEHFREQLKERSLLDQFRQRCSQDVLVNRGICIRAVPAGAHVSVTLTYKVAAEIGHLGDNIRYLRRQITADSILQELIAFPIIGHTVLSHTRWASVGAITEANCHPVDNSTLENRSGKNGNIYVCLNGDIDNYLDLKAAFENSGNRIHGDVTTDTKIIPLQIEKYLNAGCSVTDAFRRAVNDFEGSHAIAMHCDLSPGKIFLAHRGSGQAIFVGMASDHYMPASEVYGFIEETPAYIKLDGEKIFEGESGSTHGQIFILNQESGGGLDGIQAMFYDGTPLTLTEKDVKYTNITTRDIDRQNFSHYFLKEISESPRSVEKTLQGRWKIKEDDPSLYDIVLDDKTFTDSLKSSLLENKIRRVFFVGQGTAGVAALACANIFQYYLGDPLFQISALKSSELSGFQLNEDDAPDCLADALVIAISQSGTTTDTNRTVDMVRERGAHTIAIVNRRDSDITFKVDGVMYTSSGRDIEMSVASTKAFYSQIVAGALLGLYISRLKGCRDDRFVSTELKQLLALPDQMDAVLRNRTAFENSARRLAVTKTYWAAVGSGPNKAAADEIRIKLSELCYKTISSDYIEDKKHIDLSSEPLIIVCAAGAGGTVIGDIIKDTAIFQAHKATPVVIADESEIRFNPYAADVFHVPAASPHLAPILNTLAGHLWGYYAALAIHAGSEFLFKFRESIQQSIDDCTRKGLDVYEVVLENTFREKIAQFYAEFKKLKDQNRFHTAMGVEAASNLTLLLKYLSGRLPASDFEIDFNVKGTAFNMIHSLFKCVGTAINAMARPVDAIKHQAKTVTVGTSRIGDKVEGILFDALARHHFNVSHLTNSNIIVLRNLQGITAKINGAILYRIHGLNLLGEITPETTIEVLQKEGVLAQLPSRVETDRTLKGTKRIIVRQGNVYIGKGRKDDRSIIIIPIVSTASATAGLIEHLLLVTISFRENIPLPVKIKALGGKYEHIKNIVQENSITWSDKLLELVEIQNLFGYSAEKISEFIVSRMNGSHS
ncbi:MAG: SIS domain-containing protein [Thermodesulfobacteriota bacterium]